MQLKLAFSSQLLDLFLLFSSCRCSQYTLDSGLLWVGADPGDSYGDSPRFFIVLVIKNLRV